MSATPLPPTNSCDSLIQVCRPLQSRPVYAPVRRVGGEDHRPLFQTTVHVVPLGYSTQGSGPSKTIARRSAAAAMLDLIKTRHPDPEPRTNDLPQFFVDREPDPNIEIKPTSSPSRANSRPPNQPTTKPSANIPRISPLSVTQSDPRPIPPTDSAVLRNPSVPDSHSLPRINRRPLSLPPKQPFTGGVVPPPNPHYPTLDQVYPSAIQTSMPTVPHASQPPPHTGLVSLPAEAMLPDAQQAQVHWNGVRSSPAAASIPLPLSQPLPMHPNPIPLATSQQTHLDGGQERPEEANDAQEQTKKSNKGFPQGEKMDEEGWREDGELRESDEDKAPGQPTNETKEGQKEAQNTSSEGKEKGQVRTDAKTSLDGKVEGGKDTADEAGNGAATDQVKSNDATQGPKETNEGTAMAPGSKLKDNADMEYVAKLSEANADSGDAAISAKQEVETELDGSNQMLQQQTGGESAALVRSPHPPRKWRSESVPPRLAVKAAKRKRAGIEAPVMHGDVEEEELEGGYGGEAIPLRKRSRPTVEKVVRKHSEQLSRRLKLTVVAEMSIGWVREQIAALIGQGLFIEVMLVAVGGGDTGISLGECVKGVTTVSLASMRKGMALAFECGKWLERVWVERGRYLSDNGKGVAGLCPRMLVVCESAGVRAVVERAGVVDVLDKQAVGVTRFVTRLLEEASKDERIQSGA